MDALADKLDESTREMQTVPDPRIELISAGEMGLHIMALYDGLNGGVLAKLIYDRVCERLPRGAGARLSLWRFDSMNERKAERRAGRDLAEADVLIVAADGCRPLPPEVRNTLENWLLAKGARVGLVAILHGVEEQEKEFSPVHSCLEGLARKANIDFFAQAIALPAQNGDSVLIRTRRPLTLDFVWDEDSFVTSVPIATGASMSSDWAP